jgi:YcxB-like protein
MSAPLTFQVDYSFRAYRALTSERWGEVIAGVGEQAGRPVNRWERAVARACWRLAMPLVWLVKRRRVGRCQFRLDAEGVTRDSARLGPQHVPWSRFQRAQELPSGWLLHTARGAIALPKECLSPAQQEALLALIPTGLWVHGQGAAADV